MGSRRREAGYIENKPIKNIYDVDIALAVVNIIGGNIIVTEKEYLPTSLENYTEKIIEGINSNDNLFECIINKEDFILTHNLGLNYLLKFSFAGGYLTNNSGSVYYKVEMNHLNC